MVVDDPPLIQTEIEIVIETTKDQIVIMIAKTEIIATTEIEIHVIVVIIEIETPVMIETEIETVIGETLVEIGIIVT